MNGHSKHSVLFFNTRVLEVLFNSTIEEIRNLELLRNNQFSIKSGLNTVIYYNYLASKLDFNKFKLKCFLRSIFGKLINFIILIDASYSVLVTAFIYLDKLMVSNPEIFTYDSIEK